MAERLGARQRRTGMRWMPVLGLVLAGSLSACGSTGSSGPSDEGLNDLPKTGAATCLTDDQIGASPSIAVADLDGNGSPDNVQYTPKGGHCPGVLFARAGGKRRGVAVTGDLSMEGARSQAISLPGRKGQVVVITQQHPRGGFQARLFGYANGKLQELTIDGKPVLGFVATDAQSTAFSARCTDDGFEVLAARPHEPIGIVPAWDIDRTTYAVEGNTVTPGATTEIADNVLDKQLRSKYSDLVNYSLFANCRVPG